MFQMRLDEPASHILRYLHGFSPGSTLRDQARQARTRGQEPAFLQRLDPKFQVKLFNRHGTKIGGGEMFASPNKAGATITSADSRWSRNCRSRREEAQYLF